jgi:hypothetical protein
LVDLADNSSPYLVVGLYTGTNATIGCKIRTIVADLRG